MATSQGGNGGGGNGVASTDRNSGNVYQFIASNINGQANTGGGGGSAEDHDGASNIGSTGSASGAGGSGVILLACRIMARKKLLLKSLLNKLQD